MRVVFLGSGGGGNFKFFYYVSKLSDIFEVVGLIVDRDCGAKDFALANSIPCQTHSFKRDNKEDTKLSDNLKFMTPDLIITNVHKILSPLVVDNFQGKLINLHYSYLPAYGGLIGMKPVDEALRRGNKFIGVTCHEVNEKVDDGKVIAQGIIINSNSSNIYQSTFETGALTLLAGVFTKTKEKAPPVSYFKSSLISPGLSMTYNDEFSNIFEKLK